MSKSSSTKKQNSTSTSVKKKGNTGNAQKQSKNVRPPIVSILGHVDHGKTSLLDKIRETSFQAKEAGGITQSIGAYQVEKDNQKITFVDTPGHEAFTAMRARGGQVADIVVLVVAANEGVKPQTIESIGHAKAAEVPIIVAINKIDMSNADPMMVKQQLTEHGLITEDFGGDTVTVELSAMTGQGVDQLLEMIQLVAEMEDLERDADGPAKGIVLEGKQDARQGVAATLIVQNGTLKPGDVVATASTWGKVRRMTDWQGTVTKEVGPSGPVEVLGLQDVPQAGELFEVVENEKEAKDKIQELDQVAEDRSVVKDDDMKVVPLIVKADTKGALEAFLAALHSLNTDEGMVQIIHSGLSDVTEADVVLAHVSKAIVLGFNVGVDKAASSASQMERVPVMTYDVIYRALEDVEDFLESEVDQLRAIGEASVKQVFELSDGTLVAGSVMSEGHGVTGSKVEVWRGDECIGEARVKSLRHNKDKRSKVEQGEECGIILNTRIEFEPGDTILLFPS